MVQPAWAITTVSDVQVRTTSDGVEVELMSDASERPQIFLLPPQGNDLVAHVTDARLGIPGGQITRENPAPGISIVEVIQLDAATVQVTVKGAGSRPVGRIRQTGNIGNLVLAYTGTGTPAAREPQPSTGDRQASRPPASRQTTDSSSGVMVGNPNVTIDGQRAAVQPVVPPALPRAVAIPHGDIAVSDVPIRPYTVNLGTNQIIPRLVLRDAPVREVLSLLARAGGVNIAFAEAGSESGEGGGESSSRISVDIENEPVQDVFNYVLRISGLQANRVGQTVFVGKTLPNSARNVIVRSIRINQTSAENAAGFLVTLGAESASTATERQTEVVQVNVGNQQQSGGGTGGEGQVQSAPLTQTTTTERTTINELRYEPQDSIPILRGLQVAVDQRTNSLTLVGQRDLVALASEQLTRIDGRVRQVAVNVRVIDINLLETERIGTSFSFGIDGTRIVNTGGIGIINWNDRGAPFSVPPGSINGVGSAPISINGEVFGENGSPFNFSSDFLAQLQLAVVNNNAKILTDPTLVVQEGQVAQVELTEEVVGTIESETNQSGDTLTISTEVEKERAGLILGVQVDRIDDNGFISLSESPSLRIPIGEFDERENTNFGPQGIFVTLISERRLSSGRIRVRDGQTLVLAGIIQDTVRSTVTKIPILGDLPLLGALFRRTERENERLELVVLMTPQLLVDSYASTVGYTFTPCRYAQEFIRRSTER
ncbi:MAG: AMIN domain-containing protein [Cyanophyceae cyanobacterium]